MPSSPWRGACEAAGFSAPEILAEDLDSGLLILEDLGNEGVVDRGGPIAERYGAAIDVLAALHGRTLPTALPVAPGMTHVIPPFDLAGDARSRPSS